MNLIKYTSSLFSESLLRNAFYLIANSIVGSLAGFIFWLIAARLYTAEDVGLASTVISIIGMIALLSNFGFSMSLIRFLSDSKEEATDLINSCLTISASVACFLGIGFILWVDFLSPSISFIKSNETFAVIFLLYGLLTIVSNLLDNVFVGYRKVNFSFLKMGIQNILKIPLIFLLVYFGSFGIVSSYAISYLVAVMITFLVFLPKINSSYKPAFFADLSIMKKIFHYSAGNYIAWAFETMPNFILPILITNKLDPEMTAYFYMAWMVAGIVFLIPKSLATSIFAEGSHNPNTVKQNIIKSIKLAILLVIPAIIFVYFVGEKVLLLFGNEYYENGFKLLLVLSISAVPMIFNNIFLSIKRVEKDIANVIFINAVITIGTLVISYLMLDQFGILGIGIGWTVSQVAAFIFILITFVVRKQLL
ncbi:putative polysaccharide biosynthesis protein [Methanolobus psychrophilus R15]|nr:putative polysaccharide biosynthesis protein [Methanolobus psychrophilus R15]